MTACAVVVVNHDAILTALGGLSALVVVLILCLIARRYETMIAAQ